MSSELAFLALTLGKDVLIDIGTSVVANAVTGAIAGTVLPGAGTTVGAGGGALRGFVIGAIKVSRSKKYYTTVTKINKIAVDKIRAQPRPFQNNPFKSKGMGNKNKRTGKNNNEVGGEDVPSEVEKEVLGKNFDTEKYGLKTNNVDTKKWHEHIENGFQDPTKNGQGSRTITEVQQRTNYQNSFHGMGKKPLW